MGYGWLNLVALPLVAHVQRLWMASDGLGSEQFASPVWVCHGRIQTTDWWRHPPKRSSTGGRCQQVDHPIYIHVVSPSGVTLWLPLHLEYSAVSGPTTAVSVVTWSSWPTVQTLRAELSGGAPALVVQLDRGPPRIESHRGSRATADRGPLRSEGRSAVRATAH